MSTEDASRKNDSPAPRRSFIKQSLVSITGVAFATALPAEAFATTASSEAGLKLAQPFKSQRITKSETTGTAPNYQHYGEMETIGSNDVKLLSKTYTKRTDLGETYEAIILTVLEQYRASSDAKPAQSIVSSISLSGIKGLVDGDYRLDTITITSCSNQGISSDGPKQVKTLINDPATGMSDQEKLNWMIQFKAGGKL